MANRFYSNPSEFSEVQGVENGQRANGRHYNIGMPWRVNPETYPLEDVSDELLKELEDRIQVALKPETMTTSETSNALRLLGRIEEERKRRKAKVAPQTLRTNSRSRL